MEKTASVFVVDGDSIFGNAVCERFAARGLPARWYASGEQFLRGFDGTLPGCVLSEFDLPGMNGLELLKSLLARQIRTPLILLTATPRTEVTVEAIRQGAVTVLEKPCSDDALLHTVRNAFELDADMRRRQDRQSSARDRIARLTRREREVLELVVAGTPNKRIASRLGISLRTVEYRRHKIFEKTGTTSLADLIRLDFVANMETSQTTFPGGIAIPHISRMTSGAHN